MSPELASGFSDITSLKYYDKNSLSTQFIDEIYIISVERPALTITGCADSPTLSNNQLLYKCLI